ncbi:MAG: CDP-glycerol glycerophosphotransferase family protein [Desulfobacteraceae bacterium]|jgi:CDP-glycerol glycerophosphotransferase (TagB/SpsB family)|nr:CDP-glycerol glycerophosphotransferase family protein [Desulfobacteraceae bacterium]
MKKKQKKLIFAASTPMNYVMFRPIAGRLLADDRIEVVFTANHSPKKLYGAVGLRHVNLTWHQIAEIKKFDMCICPGYFYKPKKTAVKVQIFHSAGIDNYSVSPAALRFDKLFVLGPYMLEKFISTGTLSENDSRLEKIGMPKIDCLRDGSLDASAIRKQLDIDNDLPTVLYAPTRSTISGTSLEHAGEEIIGTISKMDVNFLIKLHDRNYRMWRKKNPMDWRRRLIDMKTPNMRVITDYDICPAFYVSDLLVSDVSSVSYEFCTLDRPMIFYHIDQMVERIEKKERERWGNETSDLLAWGRDCGQVVFDVPEMKAAIEYGLAHPGEKSVIRQEFTRKFFYNLGGATDKAVDKIYEYLELEPPNLSAAASFRHPFKD